PESDRPLAVGEGEEQFILGFEVGVERAPRETRRLGDRLDRGRVHALVGEQFVGGVHESLAGLLPFPARGRVGVGHLRSKVQPLWSSAPPRPVGAYCHLPGPSIHFCIGYSSVSNCDRRTESRTSVSSSLYSLGRWAAQQRRWVFVAWVALLALLGGVTVLTGGELDDGVSIPGTESQEALDTLGATFPEISGASAQVLAVAPEGQTVHDPHFQEAVESAVEQLVDTDHVMQTLSPYDTELASGMVSEDEQAALIQVQMDEGLTEVPDSAMDEIRAITDDLDGALPEGSHASYGGELFGNALPELSVTEALGVVIALVVLVLTLGSLIAAGMPLLNALAGVGVSTLLIFIVAALAPINSTTPMLALMLGLAVGIDYALFIVARHQDQLRHGMEVQESIGRALATAGSAVVFAGLTVMIALLGLGVAGIPFLTTMGVAAAAAVGVAVFVSLTLTPALLASAGERLLKAPRPSRRSPRAKGDTAGGASGRSDRFFRGWVRAATRWPVVTIVVVLAGVIAVAAPALHLRLVLPDAASLPEDDPARVTYELVEEHFGEGFNGPLIV